MFKSAQFDFTLFLFAMCSL